MASNKNRVEYQHRINRVQDYIREHRSDELTLETLAEVAAFSPFHFHRIFKSMTGENVKEFIQRTRLESAANQLASGDEADVLTIALDNGFNSASGFARAFKERFGITATAWRSARHPGCLSKPEQADRNSREANSKPGQASHPAKRHDEPWSRDDADLHQEEIMNVTVKTLPAYRIAYMRHVGPYGAAGGIPELWQQLMRWAAARELWTEDRICLGMALDNPMVTAPAKCRYDAGIVVPADFKGDTAVNLASIPGGKYATCAFVGSSKDIDVPWRRVYSWLPSSGYQPENRGGYEIYRGNAWDGKTDTFCCEVCVPVRPL